LAPETTIFRAAESFSSSIVRIMADLSTATYLKDNVGPALTKAMAALSTAQPNDAVDFLGKWLLRYAETEEARIETAKQEAEFAQQREKKQEELKKEAERLKAIEDEKAAKLKTRDDLIEDLGSTTQWKESYYDELVKIAKENANARQVYLGWVDEEVAEGEGEGGGPCIRYSNVAGSDEELNELLSTSTLQSGKGVTMGVFEEKQPPDAGEGATEVPEGFRKFDAVWVPEVTDNANIHYFDLTRLGSYMAVPVIYNTYYHEEALTAAVDHENKCREITLANEAFKAEYPDGTEDGQMFPEGGGELPVLQLPGKPVKMVLCLDTLCPGNSGDQKMQDLDGTSPPTEELFKLVDAMTAAKTRCEEAALCKQAQLLNEQDKRAEMADIYSKAKEAEQATCDSNTANALADLGEEATDAQKQMVELEHKFLKEKNIFMAMAGYVNEMAQYVVVEKEVMAALGGLLLLIGRSKEQVFIKNKDPLGGLKSMSWPQLQKQVNQDMFDKVKGLVPTGPRKGLETAQKVEFIKGLVPALEVDAAAEMRSAQALQALLAVVKAGLDYRAHDVSVRKDEHSKKLREAEDSGSAEKPPPLEAIDDDFVD